MTEKPNFQTVQNLAIEAIQTYSSAQKPKELALLGKFIIDCGFKTAIEIGTSYGGTSWFLWKLGLSVTSIDDCPEEFLRQHANPAFHVVRIPEITYIVGDGRQEGLDPADVIFIDGNHTYAGVSADWEHWRSRVNPGGIAVFHDIIADVPENMVEVKRLFDEIAAEYSTLTYIDPTDDGFAFGGFDESGNRRPWGGIGVVLL